MVTVISIVEGKGEVEAVPVLLRRIATCVLPNGHVNVPRPIRVQRNKILKDDQLERTVEFAARKLGQGEQGGILILLDADDDCPREIAAEMLSRAHAVRPDRGIRVVLAKREYETWFLAAAHSIDGRRQIDDRWHAMEGVD